MPCPRCGKSQNPSGYCVKSDDGLCIRYESKLVPLAAIKRMS